MIDNVAVIGAGSLGTALAQLLSRNVNQVYLFARREKIVEDILKKKCNCEYFPAFELSHKIIPISTFENFRDFEILFFCVPSSGVREVARSLKDSLNSQCIIVSTAKGIEYPSIKTMGQIIYEELGIDAVVLSGPTFASNILLNLPTIATIASKNINDLYKVKAALVTDNFLVSITYDVIGTEICSILKNINAIAYGICEGIKINENAKYSILTVGFNETKEIVSRLGGDPKTVDTYCGFGDITLSSTSSGSRNHTLGMLYGQGIVVDESTSGILFEGKKSIRAIKTICDRYGIKSNVTNFVYEVVFENHNPYEAFRELWANLRK